MEQTSTPRVSAALIDSFVGQNVIIVGKVLQLRGDTAFIESDGQIQASLNRECHLMVGNGAQIIGKVNSDLSVKVLSAMDLGDNVDFQICQNVVDVTHHFKDIFSQYHSRSQSQSQYQPQIPIQSSSEQPTVVGIANAASATPVATRSEVRPVSPPTNQLSQLTIQETSQPSQSTHLTELSQPSQLSTQETQDTQYTEISATSSLKKSPAPRSLRPQTISHGSSSSGNSSGSQKKPTGPPAITPPALLDLTSSSSSSSSHSSPSSPPLSSPLLSPAPTFVPPPSSSPPPSSPPPQPSLPPQPSAQQAQPLPLPLPPPPSLPQPLPQPSPAPPVPPRRRGRLFRTRSGNLVSAAEMRRRREAERHAAELLDVVLEGIAAAAGDDDGDGDEAGGKAVVTFAMDDAGRWRIVRRDPAEVEVYQDKGAS
ncbi:replication factor A protein 3-domain-containing protein [Durotheca rogersii]|uniref:replication factor A protein 3-domain-containing protein n=1 Tax=Durotheca rogersii TaxID=419775 RepID=UPI0022207D05|nr:replication factor A protein 3-domain-containing protein [Durotheca rogersii]KAI5865493.1 replication factor A protein 3-domain-containing protein [Durotheca rogersii]